MTAEVSASAGCRHGRLPVAYLGGMEAGWTPSLEGLDEELASA
jgi:hypothetical protein